MYAQLGNNIFDGLLGFDAFESTKETNLVEQALIENKPRLQRVGTNLEKLRITIILDASFCVPSDVIASLDASREAAEIMPLIMGSGEVLGDFVIRGIQKTHEHCADDGTLYHATLSLDLVESAEADPIQAVAIAAIRGGFANQQNSPQTYTLFQSPQTPAGEAMAGIAAVDADTTSVSSSLQEASVNPALEPSVFQSVMKRTERMMGTVSSTIAIINNSGQQIYNATRALEAQLNNAQTAIQNLNATVSSGNMTGSLGALGNLQSAMSGTKSAASSLTALTVFQ